MTTLVLPSVDADVKSFAAAMMNRYGSLTEGWVQESGGMFIANQYADFNDAAMPFGGFEYLPGDSSDGTAVFDTGEAVIAGAYVGKDETTAVDINPNSTDTYYLGYSNTGKNTLIIGRATEFDNGDRPDDPRVPLWDITTGNNGAIESANDLRVTELRINVRNDGTAANADLATESEDAYRVGGILPGSLVRNDDGEQVIDGTIAAPEYRFSKDPNEYASLVYEQDYLGDNIGAAIVNIYDGGGVKNDEGYVIRHIDEHGDGEEIPLFEVWHPSTGRGMQYSSNTVYHAGNFPFDDYANSVEATGINLNGTDTHRVDFPQTDLFLDNDFAAYKIYISGYGNHSGNRTPFILELNVSVTKTDDVLTFRSEVVSQRGVTYRSVNETNFGDIGVRFDSNYGLVEEERIYTDMYCMRAAR